MHKYIVSACVDGRIDIPVEANNPVEAKEKADAILDCGSYDINDIEIIDTSCVNCTDENDNLTDY